MKKVKLSLAALALIIAIAGTATANANSKEADPCSKVDPKGVECTDEFPIECCEDDNGKTWDQRNPL
jgi:hypothetical protein